MSQKKASKLRFDNISSFEELSDAQASKISGGSGMNNALNALAFHFSLKSTMSQAKHSAMQGMSNSLGG